MSFTCICCYHKFNQNTMDCEERMCYDCMEVTYE